MMLNEKGIFTYEEAIGFKPEKIIIRYAPGYGPEDDSRHKAVGFWGRLKERISSFFKKDCPLSGQSFFFLYAKSPAA